MARKKSKGIGPKALREAIAGINKVSADARLLLPDRIAVELAEKFPMRNIKAGKRRAY